jgi:hypothetical protein
VAARTKRGVAVDKADGELLDSRAPPKAIRKTKSQTSAKARRAAAAAAAAMPLPPGVGSVPGDYDAAAMEEDVEALLHMTRDLRAVLALVERERLRQRYGAGPVDARALAAADLDAGLDAEPWFDTGDVDADEVGSGGGRLHGVERQLRAAEHKVAVALGVLSERQELLGVIAGTATHADVDADTEADVDASDPDFSADAAYPAASADARASSVADATRSVHQEPLRLTAQHPTVAAMLADSASALRRRIDAVAADAPAEPTAAAAPVAFAHKAAAAAAAVPVAQASLPPLHFVRTIRPVKADMTVVALLRHTGRSLSPALTGVQGAADAAASDAWAAHLLHDAYADGDATASQGDSEDALPYDPELSAELQHLFGTGAVRRGDGSDADGAGGSTATEPDEDLPEPFELLYDNDK